MSEYIFHPASERGHINHGWLDTYHYFSFASWYNPAKVHFGKLRVINDDTVDGGMGFGKHPHDNMEIITVVTDGSLEHKDSMGNTEVIHTDEVQVMSAGSGLFHSEYNHERDKKVHLFQIWIFPDKQNVAPRYEQRYFLKDGRTNQLQTIVSPMDKSDDGLKIHQDAWIYRIALDGDKTVEIPVHSGNHGLYVLVIDGQISLDSHQLNKRDALGVYKTNKIKLSAIINSDVLILEVPMN